MEHFKLPPHSDESEYAFLGAVFERNSLIDDVENIINSESFYRAEHKTIFQRMSAMAFVSQPIDPITLVTALEAAGEIEQAGGHDYIIDLATSGRGAHNAIHYARTIHDKALDRDLIRRGIEVSDLGYAEGEAAEKIDKAQSIIMDASPESVSEISSAHEAMRETVEHIEFLFKNQGKLTGITTGFADLDRITYGLQPADLIVVAGRPSMGKTTLAMNLAEAAMQAGEVVLVFSLEMPKHQLMTRMMCSLGNLPLDHVKRGNMDDEGWAKLSAAGAKVKASGANLYIDDRASLTSEQLLSRARKLSKRIGKKIGMVVIDYMQLMTDKGEGVERMTKISRNIKLAAKELNCPVVALSQLSRKCEERGEKRPISSDLRESGAIEQDADLILMVYRDEVYHADSAMKGVTEALIRKHRNGEIGTVYLTSRLDVCRFDNNIGYMPPLVLKESKRYAAF